ncbi:MAG: dihydroorotate dehydrogenase electron transfer subunit [Clostridiales bacterium]|jgi:dihydroorotate dehydrogenase electron transfer subunit|nr:dihydroorotate dehydrogenase electron transfer subunit [Eubacteriales bacterium]MDH7565151.1 dihydroorotate dehydrogenase electron transfer subunit [Clostridiales bacterium]
MPKVLKEKILRSEALARSIYRMTVESEYISQTARPGQFVNLKCSDGIEPVLRRPISICRVNREQKTFELVFQVRGRGTELLSRKKAGDSVDILGPLGNPFEISAHYKKIAVVGGGIGIFPLLFILDEYGKHREDNLKAFDLSAFIGFRDKDSIVLKDEFEKACDTCRISTEDGSAGCRGFVTGLLEEELSRKHYDIIYTCGPTAMMKKVAETAGLYKVPCQVSLEQRMGCGIGACLVCACKTKYGDGWEYSHVCKDGPVFWCDRVIFDEQVEDFG